MLDEPPPPAPLDEVKPGTEVLEAGVASEPLKTPLAKGPLGVALEVAATRELLADGATSVAPKFPITTAWPLGPEGARAHAWMYWPSWPGRLPDLRTWSGVYAGIREVLLRGKTVALDPV